MYDKTISMARKMIQGVLPLLLILGGVVLHALFIFTVVYWFYNAVIVDEKMSPNQIFASIFGGIVLGFGCVGYWIGVVQIASTRKTNEGYAHLD